MIRIAVLPYCRSGIVGGAMLGLGRAIGETIAVTILIGGSTQMVQNLFGQSNSLAAVIANEFGEATGTHRSALFACGLVLFVLTLLVNGIARGFVVRGGRASGPPRAEEHRSKRDGCRSRPTRRRGHERARRQPGAPGLLQRRAVSPAGGAATASRAARSLAPPCWRSSRSS